MCRLEAWALAPLQGACCVRAQRVLCALGSLVLVVLAVGLGSLGGVWLSSAEFVTVQSTW